MLGALSNVGSVFSSKFVTSFSHQKCSNSKNKKHTIFKNDMFYVGVMYSGEYDACDVL